jgi:acyltransferase
MEEPCQQTLDDKSRPDGWMPDDSLAEARNLATETMVCSDGTSIVFERSGEGRPVVVVGGGLNDRATFAPLAEELSRDFTVFNYDRRGRGSSGDGDPELYTTEREVEDLEAMVNAAGEECFVFANCTGGMLAVRAAARCAGIAKLALFEPPYYVGGDRLMITDSYLRRLRELIEAGRNEDAIGLFQKEEIGLSDEVIAKVRLHPAFSAVAALAPSLLHDTLLAIDHGVPTELMANIRIPVLVLDGGNSAQWMLSACEAIAEAMPNGRHVRVEGMSHIPDQTVIGPLLAEFFSS